MATTTSSLALGDAGAFSIVGCLHGSIQERILRPSSHTTATATTSNGDFEAATGTFSLAIAETGRESTLSVVRHLSPPSASSSCPLTTCTSFPSDFIHRLSLAAVCSLLSPPAARAKRHVIVRCHRHRAILRSASRPSLRQTVSEHLHLPLTNR